MKDLDALALSGWAHLARAAALFEAGRAEQAADLLVAEVGGERAAADPRRLAGDGARAADPLPARCRPARGGRARRRRGGGVCRGGRACRWPRRCPRSPAQRSTSTPGIRRAPPSGRSKPRPCSTAPGPTSTRRRSRTLAGRALAQAGDKDRAAVELERAAAAFDSFGSARYRAAAEQELRKLGHRIHRRSHPGKTDATGVASLTARELEIARLVVDRKTNPEIAAALFLSPKTVETHLRNVFHKLDVSSRVECRPTAG